MTVRDHLQQVEKQLGRRPEELEPPCEFPTLLNHVWVAFCVLNGRRQTGISGVDPLTFTEIKHWKELTETPMKPKDIDLIIRLDQTYMRVANDRS